MDFVDILFVCFRIFKYMLMMSALKLLNDLFIHNLKMKLIIDFSVTCFTPSRTFNLFWSHLNIKSTSPLPHGDDVKCWRQSESFVWSGLNNQYFELFIKCAAGYLSLQSSHYLSFWWYFFDFSNVSAREHRRAVTSAWWAGANRANRKNTKPFHRNVEIMKR